MRYPVAIGEALPQGAIVEQRKETRPDPAKVLVLFILLPQSANLGAGHDCWEGGLAFARVTAREAAERYAETGFAQARAQLVTSIAAQVAGGSALAAPQPLEAGAACTAGLEPMPIYHRCGVPARRCNRRRRRPEYDCN